ncbi:hypothetical protein [Brevibacterium casei]|uniref:Uncharacterized protein n=1 Tax=Brevibacterium casei TaxID=33889 RepID=A0AB34XTI2_9MICO|nr:hypothetical protein [Brevibacterium casei]KZE19149.1 hypothetical protein AVW13_11880 [Brevibacterium casei]
MRATNLSGAHIGARVRITLRNGAVYEDRIRSVNHDCSARMSTLAGTAAASEVTTTVTFESHAYVYVQQDELVEIVEEEK